jgi:hypothetical protein
LFPLFATGIIDTCGKFAVSIIDTGGKMPPVSTTLAKLVAKFAAGVFDVVHFDLRISLRIFEKI